MRHKRCSLNPWVRKISWSRKWQPHSSILENPMDRGAWWATVHGTTKSWTQLSTSIVPFSDVSYYWYFLHHVMSSVRHFSHKVLNKMSSNVPLGYNHPLLYHHPLKAWASLVAQMVKNPPAMQQTWDRFLGWEDPLEVGVAIHSSILTWRIPVDRRAWWATAHGVAKGWTQLSDKAQFKGVLFCVTFQRFLQNEHFTCFLWSLVRMA